jgi:hypothetical protein
MIFLKLFPPLYDLRSFSTFLASCNVENSFAQISFHSPEEVVTPPV